MDDMTPTPEWIAVDWGTTRLRIFAMQGSQMLARINSDKGMGVLSPEAFDPVLTDLLAPWNVAPGTRVVACGMVGSRQGWIEAPYRKVPCRPLGEHLTQTRTKQGLSLHVISGVAQNDPADVMRGEETQIAGFLAMNPGWDGVICLPGTHTKWVQVSADEIVSFQTFMTGELFALLSEQSVLRHSVSGDGWEEDAFVAALSDAMSKPERLAARLFGLRAADLLQDVPEGVGRAQLSGLLIGAELAAARPYWLGQNVAILGGNAQSDAYANGLMAQGVPTTLADAERMTLAGLTAAYRRLKDTT